MKRTAKDRLAPLASKLREARIARGLSVTELAEKIDVTRQSVSKYEAGESIPGNEVFYKIMQTLQFPLSFFLKDDNTPIDDDGLLFFRSLKSADRKNLDISEVRSKWIKLIYYFLSAYINFPALNLPEFDDNAIKSEYTSEDIEEIAYTLRKYWGLGDGPINNLTYTLEKNGFIITRLPINDMKIDAFSKWIDGVRPICFLGSDKNCAVRSRFDLAHEVGHSILHRHLTKHELYDPKKLKKIESEANRFASAFLLPKKSFGSEVMSASLEHFTLLKQRWKVSIQAMIYRCHQLGYLTDDQTLYLRKKMSKLNMKAKEPLDDILEVENPVVLRQAIEMLLKNKVIDKHILIEKINIPVNELEELLSLDPGTLSESAKIVTLNFK